MGFVVTKISGGYYIKARKIMDSKIMRSPPVVRELWDFLIMSAWFKDSDFGNIKRGQVLTTTNDIIDGLSWYVGYSKRGYSEKQIRSAMKVLAQGGMLVTTKVTNGTLITICNYSLYQDFNSYEGNRVGNRAGQAQVNNYNEKEIEKEIEKENNKDKGKKIISKPEDVSEQVWNDFLELRKERKSPVTETAISRSRQEAAKIKWTLEQALIECCLRGWQGFKAEYLTQKTGINQNGKLSQNGIPRVQRTKGVTAEEFASLCNPDLS